MIGREGRTILNYGPAGGYPPLREWIAAQHGVEASQVVISLTEPMLAPVRRILPPAGMFDFSSLLVLVVLGVIWRALLR